MPQVWAEVGCPLWLDAAEWLLTHGAAETVCKELTEYPCPVSEGLSAPPV